MDRWLKKGSLSKQSRSGAVSTGVTDVKSESQCFTSHSIIGSYRTPGSGTERKYGDSYFWLGFTYTGYETAPDSLCVLCNYLLPSSSVLPVRRRGYRDTNYPDYKDKVITFIWRRAEALTNCLTPMVKSSETDNEKASESSSRESYNTELVARAHTVSETLIKPCAVAMVTCVFGEESTKKLETVQSSNNTVKYDI
jgi:hypothetical protein